MTSMSSIETRFGMLRILAVCNEKLSWMENALSE